MRKTLRVLPMLLSLALIAGMAQAATAPKAGSAYKTAGQTITAGGKKYTCIKSGKKLVCPALEFVQRRQRCLKADPVIRPKYLIGGLEVHAY